jgi:hypothetical protein
VQLMINWNATLLLVSIHSFRLDFENPSYRFLERLGNGPESVSSISRTEMEADPLICTERFACVLKRFSVGSNHPGNHSATFSSRITAAIA